ncbi:hypothetical protein SAMN06265379_106121 [Saccharicrinis carchari]|uniref:Uncharacterized protein n=1 Tax=Saccharicrinis carchari TaxID=1168039 RepID=A0A521DS18_SACCC|nr:hypothetical protein [Saccharicrinis carchari]SMO74516.1 hypothetical protein SAMN06265379_106121 [Saccharicrinis carchari]
MTKLSKILSLVLYALLGVTVVLTIMYFTGGDVPGETFRTPVYTDTFLNWAKILVVATAAIVVLFELVNIVLNPKNAVRSLISAGVLIVIALVSYSMADDTALRLSGYEGADNVPSMLKMAGAFLYGTYILLGIVFVTILGTELSKIFK